MRVRWIAAAVGGGLLSAHLAAAEPCDKQLEYGDLLVTSLATGQVYCFDLAPPEPGELEDPVTPLPVPTGGPFVSPRGLAVDRNGLLLVTDNGRKTLERVNPSQDLRQLATVKFSQEVTFLSNLRGVAAASDGRVFIANPGLIPAGQQPLRGTTYFPMVSEVDVIARSYPGVGAAVGGCDDRWFGSGKAACGNLYFPSGLAIESKPEDPELVLLVADAGWPSSDGAGRERQGVIKVFPDRPFEPPILSPAEPTNPPYPVIGEGINDELFCPKQTSTGNPFATPRSLTIDRCRDCSHGGNEGADPKPYQDSVLVTDSGLPGVFRVSKGGCGQGDPAVIPVHVGSPLVRPVGIAVADDGTIFVADATADAVFRIDVDGEQGTAKQVTSLPGSIDGAWDLQIYRAQPGPYFVADASVPAVLEVNPAVPSRETRTSGSPLVAPAALEVLPEGGGLVVADPAAHAVIEAALGGSQTVSSQAGHLTAPTSASREADGTYLVTDLGDAAANPPIPPAVIRIDLRPGSQEEQTVVSEGGKLVNPVAGAIDGSGFLIVADAGGGNPLAPPRIVRISPTAGLGDAGQATLFVEEPPRRILLSPSALALDEGGDVILVADRGDGTETHPPAVLRLVRLAEPPGEVDLVVGLASAGLLETPAGLAIDTDRSILVTDGGDANADPPISPAVIRVDALSGLQSLVATAGILGAPTGIGVREPAVGPFLDQDGDGITDAEDNCLAVANTDQRDLDSDAIGNTCDPEKDGDDITDAEDNCLAVANTDQLDTDGDQIGNACDPDYDNIDGVGVTDFRALRKAFGSAKGDPSYHEEIDVDGDGAIGALEFGFLRSCFGTLPGVSGLLLDFDPEKPYCRPLPASP